jgi:hypothetical protein
VWIVVCLFLLSACNTTSQITESQLDLEKDPGLSWWRVKFRFQWPQDEDPDLSYHALIADQVLRPVIDQYGEAMPLWRFHRRALRDGAGHQFSFIYYANEETREAVKKSITADASVQKLSAQSILLPVRHTRGSAENSHMVAATSDAGWPDEIQRSWPYFIMGVSQTWLDLIREFREKQGPVPADSIEHTLDYYSILNQQLSDQWGIYGRHAYLHHLNAIFGYLPVYIRETDQWQYF